MQFWYVELHTPQGPVRSFNRELAEAIELSVAILAPILPLDWHDLAELLLEVAGGDDDEPDPERLRRLNRALHDAGVSRTVAFIHCETYRMGAATWGS